MSTEISANYLKASSPRQWETTNLNNRYLKYEPQMRVPHLQHSVIVLKVG